MIWMELLFSDGISDKYQNFNSILLNLTGVNQSSNSSMVVDFMFFERYRYKTHTPCAVTIDHELTVCIHCRHYTSLSWIGLVLFILTLSLLLFTCAGACKSQATVNV